MKRKLSIPVEGRYQSLFSEALAEAQKQEPAWMVEQRATAFAHFVRGGIPTRRVEAWKYTDVTPLAKQEYQHSKRDAKVPTHLLEQAPFGEEQIRLVFVDGLFRAEVSRVDAEAGLSIMPLRRAVHDKDLRGAVTQTNPAMESPFVCLNRALWRDGLLIRLSGKRHLERTLHISFLQSEQAGERISAPRLVLALGDLAEANVVVSHLGGGKQRGLTSGVFDIQVGDGARLALTSVQAIGPRCVQFWRTRMRQGRDSSVRATELSLGGALARHDLSAAVKGQGAELYLDGAYGVRNRQVMAFHTEIEHCTPNSSSRQLYKGLLDDRGTGTFNGLVRVHPGAHGTDGEQMNRSLLLSPNAKANSKPELEILNDDVRCTHGATIGQLDEQELFYLASRGIDPVAARELLCQGFLGEVLYRIDDAKQRDALRSVLQRWFEDGQVDTHL